MRDPLHWLSIRYKLAFGFAGLCLVAFGVGGYCISRSAKETLETEIMKRLAFQSQAYATDLHASLEMLTRRSEDFVSDGYIRDHLQRIVNTTDPAAADILRAELHRHLRVNKLPLESAFMNLTVVSAFGDRRGQRLHLPHHLDGVQPGAGRPVTVLDLRGGGL